LKGLRNGEEIDKNKKEVFEMSFLKGKKGKRYKKSYTYNGKRFYYQSNW